MTQARQRVRKNPYKWHHAFAHAETTVRKDPYELRLSLDKARLALHARIYAKKAQLRRLQ
jgi:hypothetical protein